ncbi:uncharacterized protein ACR2FA_005614 [Aphomia sociella]
MVKNIIFMDILRQEEIENFYKACQMHREYYKGYPKKYHPLTFFQDTEYSWQCSPEMSHVYLSFPSFHVKYKQPAILSATTKYTSGFPQLPDRSLSGHCNKATCKAFVR